MFHGDHALRTVFFSTMLMGGLCLPTAYRGTQWREASPVAVTHGVDHSIALVLGGKANHRHHPDVDYTVPQVQLIRPLLEAGWHVAIFIATEDEKTSREWGVFWAVVADTLESDTTPCRLGIHIEAMGARYWTPRYEDSTFASHLRDPCVSYHCGGWWSQWSHLRASYDLLARWEDATGSAYSHVGKIRNDFVYHPNHTLTPEHLLCLPAGEILVPSVEFHARDRFMERPVPLYPEGCSDQMAFGNREDMATYFGMILWKHSRMGDIPRCRSPGTKKAVAIWSIENLLGAYLASHGIRVRAIELQYSRPGYQMANGENGHWVTTPCHECFEPDCRI